MCIIIVTLPSSRREHFIYVYTASVLFLLVVLLFCIRVYFCRWRCSEVHLSTSRDFDIMLLSIPNIKFTLGLFVLFFYIFDSLIEIRRDRGENVPKHTCITFDNLTNCRFIQAGLDKHSVVKNV